MRTEAAVSCFLLVLHSVCCQSGSEENWIDPHHSWSNLVQDFNEPDGSCQCPAIPERSPAAVEDALAFTYFRKFVNILFQRKRLQFDAESALHKRSLLFSLRTSQLEELERVQDVRDLDVLLTKILESVEEATLFEGKSGCSYAWQGVLSILVDILKDIVELTKISEVQFILFAALATTIGCLVHKRFRIRLISIVLGGIFLCGYIHTYLECNRKLDVEAMMEVMKSHQEPKSYAEMSWFSRLKGFVFQASLQDKQIEMLKKSSKLNLSFCMPDHVFFMYMNNLFLKQLEMLLEKVSETMQKLSYGLSFPFNLLAPLLLVALVGYIIKLTFKYIISPKAWASLIHNNPAPVAAQTAHQSIAVREAAGDCISGENLKMLLNVMNVSSVQQQSKQTQPLLAVSGVEELVEVPPSPQKKENLDVSDSSSKSRRSVLEEEGFTLVDDHEDDQIDNV
ncbi:uncharacterized protein LOC128251793 [Drosophila gunungcola]|uniref:Chloride channel CLIC-like protein 1 n=1 Tax=Drosophila gunungcola TaxID=103775 RepID=A0A9Q0BTT9_9MUSC|nr:uncharacterized protein LOC128251793 [Drosophila gunungcola]KAI8044347.1 hypothetical protein M5D96_000503 [Drosophila gunungcola]